MLFVYYLRSRHLQCCFRARVGNTSVAYKRTMTPLLYTSAARLALRLSYGKRQKDDADRPQKRIIHMSASAVLAHPTIDAGLLPLKTLASRTSEPENATMCVRLHRYVYSCASQKSSAIGKTGSVGHKILLRSHHSTRAQSYRRKLSTDDVAVDTTGTIVSPTT